MSLRICTLLFLAVLCEALPAREPTRVLKIDGGDRSMATIQGTNVGLFGDSTLTLSNKENPIGNGVVHFESENGWLILEGIRPSEVLEKYVKQFRVDGIPAVHGRNLRLSPWVSGTVVIPHGKDYAGLLAYREERFRGKARGFVVHKYHKSKELGEDEDRIESIVVKKGYMATLAENEDGSGFSKVYVARDKDIQVSKLPSGLRGKVSFIRVFPWRWTGKRGFGGGMKAVEKLNCAWRYGWDAGGNSTMDIEYVPMRHNRHWDSFSKINSKKNVTHLLGFNEPMQKDQANMSMEDCLKMWPKLMESGLRLGSPCPTDGTTGWVIDFVNKAKKRGYRVDFVTVHYYKADWSSKALVSWLKDIHRKTGLPIWLTEFNNGADWTGGHNPSMKENARRLEDFCEAMDKADFIERYAVFNLGNRKFNRQVIIDGKPTEAGERYRDLPWEEALPENID